MKMLILKSKQIPMKKLLLFLVVSAFVWTACGNKNSNANENRLKKTELSADAETKGEVIVLTRDVFLQKVWNYNTSPAEWKYLGDKPAIIDFYADWCAPCRRAAPILDAVSKEYAGKVNVYKIDTQVERELAAVFGIQSIPAFLYIPVEGKPVMAAGIGRTDEETKQMFVDNIQRYLLAENQ